MVAKINSLGGHAKINTYGALGHDVWETVYAKGELFDWLLAQRRHAAAAAVTSSPIRHTASAIVPSSRSTASAAAMQSPY